MSLKAKLLAAAAVLALSMGAIAVQGQTTSKDVRVSEEGTQVPKGAQAQEGGTPAQPAKPQQPWILNCSNQNAAETLSCTMTQAIVARETNQRVMTATIFRDPQTKALRMQLQLPHGLDLPAGISLWVDDKPPVRNEIKTADQNGSYSMLAIDDALLAGLRAGAILNVSVKAVTGRDVILQLSLAGFASAIERV